MCAPYFLELKNQSNPLINEWMNESHPLTYAFAWLLVLNARHPLTYEFVCLVGFRTRYKRRLVVEECVGSSFPQNGCPAQRWNMAVIISKFVAGSRANITLSQEIRIVLTMSWFVRVKERFLVSILSISSSQARRPNRSVHFFIFFLTTWGPVQHTDVILPIRPSLRGL